MLAPTGETLDLFKASLKVVDDASLEILLVRFELNPEFLYIGQCLFVQLNSDGLLRLTFCRFRLFLFLTLLNFEVHMGEEIIILFLTCTSWLRNEIINRHLFNFLWWNRLRVIQSDLKVEKWLVATLCLTVTLSIVEVHDHDVIELLLTVLI